MSKRTTTQVQIPAALYGTGLERQYKHMIIVESICTICRDNNLTISDVLAIMLFIIRTLCTVPEKLRDDARRVHQLRLLHVAKVLTDESASMRTQMTIETTNDPALQLVLSNPEAVISRVRNAQALPFDYVTDPAAFGLTEEQANLPEGVITPTLHRLH